MSGARGPSWRIVTHGSTSLVASCSVAASQSRAGPSPPQLGPPASRGPRPASGWPATAARASPGSPIAPAVRGACERGRAARPCAASCRRRRLREGPHRISWETGIARSTVYRVLARNGLARLAALSREPRPPARRYEHARPGDLLHLDTKRLGRIGPGGGKRVHGWTHAHEHRRRRPLPPPSEREVGNRPDDVDEGQRGPHPLRALDLICWSTSDVDERRHQQSDFDGSGDGDQPAAAPTELAPLLVGSHVTLRVDGRSPCVAFPAVAGRKRGTSATSARSCAGRRARCRSPAGRSRLRRTPINAVPRAQKKAKG